MTSLTVSIPEHVLQMARRRALERRTTVNEVVRDCLERYAESVAPRLLLRRSPSSLRPQIRAAVPAVEPGRGMSSTSGQPADARDLRVCASEGTAAERATRRQLPRV